MNKLILRPDSRPLTGSIEVPGDKSISHRAIILSSIASGATSITNLLESEDSKRTIDVFKKMGVEIKNIEGTYIIEGQGFEGLQQPESDLFFGNSGTTARLLMGLFAGLPFSFHVYGDPSLSNRPMNRVITPLKKMGANIKGETHTTTLPLTIVGQQLSGIKYTLPVKSAQVKSAILLAGLVANGKTTVRELSPTRDHTEIMLTHFGVPLAKQNKHITVSPVRQIVAKNITIPGDISSASFWIVGALIQPKSKIKLTNVGLNWTRTGIIDVIKQMRGSFTIKKYKNPGGEIAGDIEVHHQPLQATIIDGDLIPRLIDEIPIIALLATQANGRTIIKNAKELRVKETDRIKAITDVLTTLGASITPTKDGMIIEGNTKLIGGSVSTYNDHRIAMMISIASLICSGPVTMDDTASINVSYPLFFTDLERLLS